MLHLSLHLPRYRLQITVTKRKRNNEVIGLTQRIKGVFSVRKGSRVSRFFRTLFEVKRIKTFFGGNLVLFALITPMITPQVSAFSKGTITEVTTLSSVAIEFTTKTAVRVPLDQYTVTQKFSGKHPGVDMAEPQGNPVYPIMKGRIESTIFARFEYGNHIIINHGSGIKSLYGHLSKILVKVGDEVDTNTVIGKVGSTGWSTGSHLHLEIIENGNHINPFTVIPIK